MQVYLNPMQRQAMLTRANRTIVCAGRGTGKGLLHAAMMLENFQTMPGSTTAFVAPDARRALTNTLPSMFQHWEAWGYRRGIHWQVGLRPNRRLGWSQPLIQPEHWEYIITFYNGAIGQIIPQSRTGTSNSKSFDFIDIDEAKFINYEQLKNETLPANRGNQHHFGHLPYHHGLLITSDMPLTHAGSWFLTYEKQSTPQQCQLIRHLAAQRAHILQANPTANVTTYDHHLNHLRRTATYYATFPSTTNIDVLGRAWLAQMKRDLPPLLYQTSILCQPPTRLQDGFYSSLTDDNLYTPPANDQFILRNGYHTPTLLAAAADCRTDTDLTNDTPLAIAFDFNSNINCLVVAQTDTNDPTAPTIRILRSFHVKYQRKLPELIADFAHYYQHHPNRDILFYYDSTALGSNYAVNTDDFRQVILRELQRHHFNPRPIPIGRPLPHHEKHLLINRMLAAQARHRVLINQSANPHLLAAIQQAGVYNGHKDKRLEKTPETTESPLETRTDYTDAFDTLLIGLERFPQRRTLLRITSDF